MKVAFDASILVFLFNRRAGSSVHRAADRIDGLIESLASKKARVIIPTPALSEVLLAGKHTAQIYIETIKKYSCFQIRAFDERAAIELAAQIDDAKKKNKNRSKQPIWNKIKFDRQIVAVAKVQGATCVYSDDDQLRRFAEECGMAAKGLSDIPVPSTQMTLEESLGDDQAEQSGSAVDGHPEDQARTKGEPEEKAEGKATGKE